MKRGLLAALATIVLGCGAAAAPATSATPSPAPSTLPASAPPTRVPATAAPTPDVVATVTHIVAAIDDLARGTRAPKAWFMEEAEWMTDPDHHVAIAPEAIGDYIGLLASGLQAALADEDLGPSVRAVLALRPALAALAPTAVGPPPETPAPVKPVTVKGRGGLKTKPFDLVAGDFTVVMAGSADGNVIAELYPRDGGFLDSELLVNEIARGKYRYETQIYGVAGGSYYLDVENDGGSWAITFTVLQ